MSSEKGDPLEGSWLSWAQLEMKGILLCGPPKLSQDLWFSLGFDSAKRYVMIPFQVLTSTQVLIIPYLVSLLLPTATLCLIQAWKISLISLCTDVYGRNSHPISLPDPELLWTHKPHSSKAQLLAQKAPASKIMSLLLTFINIQKRNWLLYSEAMCLPLV